MEEESPACNVNDLKGIQDKGFMHAVETQYLMFRTVLYTTQQKQVNSKGYGNTERHANTHRAGVQ